MMKNYNIGLDIGTESVGWAVVEAGTQKIIRKGKGNKRKSLWGVRLFSPADTAEKRRQQRSTRRRYERRRQRINLLQGEFINEIDKVDGNFFKKLQESKYNEIDTNNKTILLTKEEKELIKEYNKKYHTIYHLRKDLIENKEKKDIRLVYLAIHHIIKYRGNFLYNTDGFNVNDLNIKDKLNNIFESLINLLPELEIREDYDTITEKLEEKIFDKNINDVKVNVKNLLTDISSNKKFAKEFASMIIGNQFNLNNMFLLDIEEKINLSFKGSSYEDNYEDISSKIGDKIEIIDLLKNIYDAIFLKKLFKGSKNTNISSLMVDKYNIHKNDLKYLKNLFRNDKKLYKVTFKDEECIYQKYITNKLSYEEFKKIIFNSVDNLFKSIEDKEIIDDFYNNYKIKLDNEEFLPRITSQDNGKYPYQLNKDELIKIIENQGVYYPFLLEKINDTYKIVKLFEFKIPYYVGPLVSDKKSKFAWLEKKIDNVRITPYNFDAVIDKEKTAEKFIKRMISHCTYLLEEFALPNNSILYSKFKVMNELKQIKINGNKISNEDQNTIINELFMKTNGSITERKFKNYLCNVLDYPTNDGLINITGYSDDGKFANNMQSYVDFFGENGIFENTSYTEEDAENIIEWITIFDDKDILENKVRKNYKELNNNKIKSILNKNYSGWGSLSKKLLTTKYYKDKETSLYKSILDLMVETDKNFMQIVNEDEYKFQDMIKENNNLKEIKTLNYKVVEELSTSPAVKKGIYQSLKIVKEIVDYMGYEPYNIMIEMARSNEEKKRTNTRKKHLLELYNKTKKDLENFEYLYKQLNECEDITDELFLYFIQEGKCLYTGEPLNINDFSDCEIDHIIPKALIKDNSFDNKALVLRECNQDKGSSFVLPKEYRSIKQIAWWNKLKKYNLISAKKFYRLTRKEYSDEDIQGFINRQLVETRQITKHVANILNVFYKGSKVVYLKANLSSDYRKKFELYKFRNLNDYHHAFDAYLAAVLGEYKENNLKKKINFEMVKELNKYFYDNKMLKELNYGYVLNSLDKDVYDVLVNLSDKYYDEEIGDVLFDVNKFNKTIEDTYYRNDVLISRKTEIRTGRFYKETIHPKEKGNIDLKNNMPANIYGGYLNVETSYMSLIKYNNKIKLIGIPMLISEQSKNDKSIKYEFIKKHLNIKDNFEMLKDYIPFECLMKYKNQSIYIKGYSVASKACEICNATQLRIPKEKMKEWKNVLIKIMICNKQLKFDKEFSDYTNYDIKISCDILKFLLDKKVDFPLFDREITKIEETIKTNELKFSELSKIIEALLIIYHCNSVNANLKEFKLGDRIGRLKGFNINNGTIIYNSITKLKEVSYEF